MTRNSNRVWTAQEAQRLIQLHAAGKPFNLIAAELGRTGGAVHARLSILKNYDQSALPVTPSSAARRRAWMVAEDKRLLELLAAGVAWPDIAKDIGRTRSAIENRAHVLKRRSPA